MTKQLPPRLPQLDEKDLTDAQRRVADAIKSGPRGKIVGPFWPLLRAPELADLVQQVGAYLRYESPLPGRLREWATLVTAQHWRQGFEWASHSVLAEAQGVALATLAELAAGRRPVTMTPEEAIIYDFCTELYRERGVSDARYAAARALLGEQGVVELCALSGYYTLLSMVMNVARTPAPEPTPFGNA